MTLEGILYKDRQQAGELLGAELARRGVQCAAVLGLTRGGVPVAFEVAAALKVPMDILVVKKLRSPISEELAIGAICADGTRVLREDIIRELEVPRRYLENEVAARLAEAREAERAYRGELPALDVAGASVVIVDDGIATGATMEAGVLSLRHRGASSILVATPIGSLHACQALRSVADDVLCLSKPVQFWAVGQFYLHFQQVGDDEVRRLLREGRALHATAE